MEKDQPDSLATVAVGGKEIPPPPHSHYAPSEVYSTAEPPPAYMRQSTKNTAVQIARIVALTLVAMSVILGCFILAGSYVQARASCTPEAIAALQAEMKLQHHRKQQTAQSQGEILKHSRAEALVQDPVEQTDGLQSLSDTAVNDKDVQPDTKEMKIPKNDAGKVENGIGNDTDNDNDDADDDDDDDDYDDDEFPPVHIKLPLQLDLDDIAGTLMQQARSRVSCVVERKRADEVTDGSSSENKNIVNSTDPQRYQRLSGERVAIFCESGNPQQDAQEQDIMNPIIVPLGTVQIPLQPQEPNPAIYNQFQVHTQYQVPDMQQLPLSDPRGLNHIPAGFLPPAFRGLPQLTVDMRPPRMGPQLPMMGPQVEIRQIPVEFRHFPMEPMRAMHPPPQEHQQPPMMPRNQGEEPIRTVHMFHPEQQLPQMMPPRPEPSLNRFSGEQQDQQTPPMMPPQKPVVPSIVLPAPDSERSSSFQGIPIEIRRIIQQVPMEIKNIIQHLTGESRPFPNPEAPRRELVQEFKPFPDAPRSIPRGPFPLPIEVRNLLEHGNIEGRRGQQIDSNEEQHEDPKPFPGPEDQGEEAERNFPVPVEVRNLIHQVVEGRAFPVPRFPLTLKSLGGDSDESSAEMSEEHAMEESTEPDQRPPPGPVMLGPHPQQEQEAENRPHYVQPRSVRSIPEPFAHRREKRVRRCACDCAC